MLQKKTIFSINISTGKLSDFLASIIENGQSRTSSYVCFANVHMMVTAHLNTAFKQVINNADIIAPDGKPIVKCLEIFYKQQQEKVDGMNFLPQLLQACITANLSVYFIGGDACMLEKTAVFLEKNYPGIIIAGMHAPPFTVFTEAEKKEMAGKISLSKANVVIVVLGCPKQEIWMAEMKNHISAVMLGMGAALPVLIGLKKRAPHWIQKSYMECL